MGWTIRKAKISMKRTRAEVKKSNPLASALRSVFDDSRLLSRKDWATLLGVTPAAISLWVNGRTLPRADHLSAAWDFVSSRSGVPKSVLEHFQHVAALPARKATPFASRFRGEPTVAHYMLRPQREAMLRTLSGLHPSLQEEILYRTSELGRQLGGEDAGTATKFASIPWMLQPGTRLAQYPHLSALFQVHWKNIAVFGWKPKDGNDGFFRSVAVDLLTRYSRHEFCLYYGVPPTNAKDFQTQLEHVLKTLPSDLRNTAQERIKLLEVGKPSIDELLAELHKEEERAELLVALDIGEPTQCSYAWYQNGFGLVLPRTATFAIDRALAYRPSENILRFPAPSRPAVPADLPPASKDLEASR